MGKPKTFQEIHNNIQEVMKGGLPEHKKVFLVQSLLQGTRLEDIKIPETEPLKSSILDRTDDKYTFTIRSANSSFTPDSDYTIVIYWSGEGIELSCKEFLSVLTEYTNKQKH